VNESARADLEGIRVVIDTVGFVRAMMGPTSAWGELVFRRSHQFESPSAASRSALDAAIAGATIAEVTNVPAICRDPGDDIVLATALAGEAAFILSEDNDLLDMIEYQGMQIVNGMQLLEILRG
jgi:predicted nucleic acid-binding protein